MAVTKVNGKTQNGLQAYQIRVYVSGPDGRPRQVNKLHYGTKAEADKIATELTSRPRPGTQTFRQCFEFFTERNRKDLALGYLAELRHTIELVSGWQPVVGKMTRAIFNNFLESLRSKRKLSCRTINKYGRHIVRVLKFCIDEDFLHERPEFFIHRNYRIKKAEPVILELKNLSEYVEPLCPEAQPLVKFMFYTGCRVSAACGLKWDDVYHDRLVLHEKFGQNRVIKRTDRVNQVLEEAETLHREGNDYVFQKLSRGKLSHWTRHKLHWHVTPIWRKLNPSGENVYLHHIRHTLATVARANKATDAECSAILGHTDPTSIRNYTHLNDPETAAQVLENLWDCVEGKIA